MMNVSQSRRVALITGGSRGIGAETALALAGHGYDIAFTYRNKVARANKVLSVLMQHGGRGLTLPCDMTCSEDVERLFHRLRQWTEHLDTLILNASGGLERDLVTDDPDYPVRMNRDAQVLFTDAALSLLRPG